MAADVGSMFQYWKKFDLRRLQVSAILTFLALFFSGTSCYCTPECAGLFRADVKRKTALFALIVIRNWSLSCLCSVQSLISGGATAEQHSLRATPIWDQHRGQHWCLCISFSSSSSFYSLLSATRTTVLTCTETFNALLNRCSWTQAVTFSPSLMFYAACVDGRFVAAAPFQ